MTFISSVLLNLACRGDAPGVPGKNKPSGKRLKHWIALNFNPYAMHFVYFHSLSEGNTELIMYKKYLPFLLLSTF